MDIQNISIIFNNDVNKFVMDNQPYTDLNIWLIVFGISVLFLILSHVIKNGYVIYALLSAISSIIVTMGSFTIARFDILKIGENVIFTNNTSSSVIYYSSVVEPVSYPWLSTFTIIFMIITWLNVIILILYYMYNDIDKKELIDGNMNEFKMKPIKKQSIYDRFRRRL